MPNTALVASLVYHVSTKVPYIWNQERCGIQDDHVTKPDWQISLTSLHSCGNELSQTTDVNVPGLIVHIESLPDGHVQNRCHDGVCEGLLCFDTVHDDAQGGGGADQSFLLIRCIRRPDPETDGQGNLGECRL